jgi:hypothetical protein
MTKSTRILWVRNVARVETKRNAYKIMVVKPEGKRRLRILGCKWVDNIKMGLRVIGWDNMDWIDLSIGTSGDLL